MTRRSNTQQIKKKNDDEGEEEKPSPSSLRSINYPAPLPDRSSLLSPFQYNEIKNKAQKKKPAKYHNVRTLVDGIWFHSKDEAASYLTLAYQQGEGLIRDLELQPVYPIIMNGIVVAKYLADFRYYDILRAEQIVVDVKSPPTRTNPCYRLKKKLVEAQYSITITEYPPYQPTKTRKRTRTKKERTPSV